MVRGWIEGAGAAPLMVTGTWQACVWQDARCCCMGVCWFEHGCDAECVASKCIDAVLIGKVGALGPAGNSPQAPPESNKPLTLTRAFQRSHTASHLPASPYLPQLR
jgi:hypothetical protein